MGKWCGKIYEPDRYVSIWILILKKNEMLKLLAKIAYTVVLLAQLLVSLRFVLKFVSADPKNAFSKWIFENSEPIVEPFKGLVQEYYKVGGFDIELTSLVAIVCLGLITYALKQMVKTF